MSLIEQAVVKNGHDKFECIDGKNRDSVTAFAPSKWLKPNLDQSPTPDNSDCLVCIVCREDTVRGYVLCNSGTIESHENI
jgi:translation elongation factor EF-Tu-like GTPase